MSSWFFEPLHLWRYIILQCLWLMHQKILGRARWKSPTTEAATQGMSHHADTSVCQLSWSSENHELCVYMFWGAGGWTDAASVTNANNTRKNNWHYKVQPSKTSPPPPNWIISYEIICKNSAELLSKKIQLLTAQLTEPVLPVCDHLKVTVTLHTRPPTDNHLWDYFHR